MRDNASLMLGLQLCFTGTASKPTPLPVTGTLPLTGPVGYRSAKNLTGYRGLTGGMDGVGRGGDMSRFNFILRNLASFVYFSLILIHFFIILTLFDTFACPKFQERVFVQHKKIAV